MLHLGEMKQSIIKECGFTLHDVSKEGDSFCAEISQYTPLGEDWWETFWFDGSDEDFCNAVERRSINFDVSDEAEPYILNRGKYGIPENVKDLVEDAEWKKDALLSLARCLQN